MATNLENTLQDEVRGWRLAFSVVLFEWSTLMTKKNPILILAVALPLYVAGRQVNDPDHSILVQL
jgi:hypothetical protein